MNTRDKFITSVGYCGNLIIQILKLTCTRYRIIWHLAVYDDTCYFVVLIFSRLYPLYCQWNYFLYHRNSNIYYSLQAYTHTYSRPIIWLKIEQSNWRRLMIIIERELKAMVDLICLFSFLEIDWIMIPPALEMTI